MKRIAKTALITAGIIFFAAAAGSLYIALGLYREKGDDVQIGVRRKLLVQYTDSFCYAADSGGFTKVSDPEWNSYVLMMDDQINRPEEICFYFGQDVEHQVFAVDEDLHVIWTKEFNEGEYSIEPERDVTGIALAVTDGEEADFYLEGTGMYTQVETPLTGKKVSVLGDSISAYKGYIPQYNRDYYSSASFNVQSMWWAVMAENTGMELCVINASGGSGVTLLEENKDPAHPLQGNSERCTELSTRQGDPDVILILLGGNDCLRGVPVDKIEKEYLEMLSKMKEAYPKAAIHICTYHYLEYLEKEQLEELNDMIERVAALGDVDLIDVRNCEVGKAGKNLYLFEDRIHLNEKGQILLGNYIAKELLKGEKQNG